MATPWITIWAVILSLGLAWYYVIVLAVIPLGARDIRRLFARLDAGERRNHQEEIKEESGL